MAKNILIYSDGTGQDGGVRPEQRQSNIYKMYRASRVGPDTVIDPREQIAFYDPGLGTQNDAVGLTALRKRVSKLLASATGRGITTNIADCYEFIINHWEPGDRVWLFGFSRGAYTARCVANVLMLCGVPTRTPTGELPRFRSGVREIADRAVLRVYEHGAGRERGRFEAERNELARRFRREFASGDGDCANVAPYFVGVFDTVASLGAKGPLRWALLLMFALIVAAAAGAGAGVLHWALGAPWLPSGAFATLAAIAIGSWSYLRTALKVFRPSPGQTGFGRLPRLHVAQWSGRNFDRLLSKSVRFGRHAIAIDENRADFPRLGWGWGQNVVRPTVQGGIEPLIQMWFAGNHSDIGGSYPEAESRLSDIALSWMVQESTSVPDPVMFDARLLAMHPSPAGLQHDEVATMSDTIRARTPWWLRWLTRRWTWPVAQRKLKVDATLHPSVVERSGLPSVAAQGTVGAYRPVALAKHVLLSHLSLPATEVPAK